jgi:cytochrome c-type biogenesis protein CcmF
MTEAGIQAGFTRDLFVALGEPLADGAWAMRVQIKPFVRWIWLGALLMALGGLLAATDRRYRTGGGRSAPETRMAGAQP